MSGVVYPKQVILEVTNACNLSCKGCAFHGPNRFAERKIGFMKRDHWQSAIAEVGAWNHAVHLALHGFGEPFLHPKFHEILSFAARFSNLQTGFLTNGMMMDSDAAAFLTDVGIDWVAVSIDGTNPETHRQVRRGSDLAVVEKNIHHLLEKKKIRGDGLPDVSLNMVVYPEVADQVDAFIEKWIRKVNRVMISHYRNPPSSKRWPNTPADRAPCFLLEEQLFIAWDGRIGLCCEDFEVEVSLGGVGWGTLLEQWNGPAKRRIREAHRWGRYDEIPICRDCDTWAENRVTRSLDTQTGYGKLVKNSQTELWYDPRYEAK